jgi:hypothetical protein
MKNDGWIDRLFVVCLKDTWKGREWRGADDNIDHEFTITEVG